MTDVLRGQEKYIVTMSLIYSLFCGLPLASVMMDRSVSPLAVFLYVATLSRTSNISSYKIAQ